MTQPDILDDIFDFAIDNEIEAYNFYTDLAAKMDNPEMKKVFTDFAGEEQKHKEILEDAKKGKKIKLKNEKVPDLKIADYVADVRPTPDMRYQDALVIAMKKEKASFALYTDLAELAQDRASKKLFQQLAQQEARHKLCFELEYDAIVLKED